MNNLVPGEWTLVGQLRGEGSSRPMTIDLKAGDQRQVELVVNVPPLTLAFEPPLDPTSRLEVELLAGPPVTIGSAVSQVRQTLADATQLQSTAEGWSTTQATPGAATVFVLSGDESALDLRVGLLKVPREGGLVKVKLSAPVRLPREP